MDYKACYDRLIYRAQWRIFDKDVYCEKHHILPRCLGGDDRSLNLVKLTAEEHYVAHQLLVKIYPENSKLIYAANLMSGGCRINNKSYGWIRRKVSLLRKNVPKSEEHRAKIAATLTGKIQSDETIKKRSIALTGQNRSEEVKNKISETMTGQTYPEERRLNISNGKKGTIQTAEHIAKRVAKNTGQKRSVEFGQQVSERNTGKITSEETKLKQSIAKKGKKASPEKCEQIGAIRRGKKFGPLSAEHSAKLSIAQKARFERKRNEKQLLTDWSCAL